MTEGKYSKRELDTAKVLVTTQVERFLGNLKYGDSQMSYHEFTNLPFPTGRAYTTASEAAMMQNKDDIWAALKSGIEGVADAKKGLVQWSRKDQKDAVLSIGLGRACTDPKRHKKLHKILLAL